MENTAIESFLRGRHNFPIPVQNFLLLASTLILLCSFGYTLFRLGSGRLRPGRTNLAALVASFFLILGDLWIRGKPSIRARSTRSSMF
jgi:hypothetical protein